MYFQHLLLQSFVHSQELRDIFQFFDYKLTLFLHRTHLTANSQRLPLKVLRVLFLSLRSQVSIHHTGIAQPGAHFTD